jgi:hypothetical protein
VVLVPRPPVRALRALAGRVCACKRRPFRRRTACRAKPLLHPAGSAAPPRAALLVACSPPPLPVRPQGGSPKAKTRLRKKPVAFASARRAKCASRQKIRIVWRCVFVLAAQVTEATRESARNYDDTASGQSIYTYVDGNPLSFTDPFGLSGNAADRRGRERNEPGKPDIPKPPDNRPAWEKAAQMLNNEDYTIICLELSCPLKDNACTPFDTRDGTKDFIPSVPTISNLPAGCTCTRSALKSPGFGPPDAGWDDWAEMAAKWRQRNTTRR